MDSALRHGGGAPDRERPLLYLALVILLAVFAIAPLTYPGSFQTHTGLNAVYNLVDLLSHPSIAWSPTFGGTFDLFRTDGPLPYWAAVLFHLAGFPFVDAVKLVYALALLASGVGMYALARRVFRSDAAGLLAAMIYVYFPYHLAVVYVRGAPGEATAMAIFPFALLPLTRQSITRRDVVLCAVLFALLVLTLPGLALLFGIFALAMTALLAGRRVLLRPVAGSVLAGIGAGALLLSPVILQNGVSVRADAFTPAFVYPFQLLTASWGSAVPKGNFLEEFPYQIGIAGLGLAILSLALHFRPVDETAIAPLAGIRRVVLVGAFAAVVLALLMTPLFAPLWELTRATALVQYPFELLGFVGIALALVSASVVVAETRLRQTPMLAALAAIPVLAVYSYLAPNFSDFLPSHPPLAEFNQNEIALLDARIVRPPGVLRHGATVELDLQWQALREINHDYTVFVHVDDENGKTWGSQDTKPQNGELPTIRWQMGQVISDTHTVQIDLTGPPEGYHLDIGLYTAANGERAVTATGATEVRVDEQR